MVNFYGYLVSLKLNGTDGSRFPMTNPECIIGTSATCSIRVHRDGIARKQCKITVEENGMIYLENLNQKTPLYFQNKVVASTLLKSGEIFKIIDREFRWEANTVKSKIPIRSKRKRSEILRSTNIQRNTNMSLTDDIFLNKSSRSQSSEHVQNKSLHELKNKSSSKKILSNTPNSINKKIRQDMIYCCNSNSEGKKNLNSSNWMDNTTFSNRRLSKRTNNIKNESLQLKSDNSKMDVISHVHVMNHSNLNLTEDHEIFNTVNILGEQNCNIFKTKEIHTEPYKKKIRNCKRSSMPSILTTNSSLDQENIFNNSESATPKKSFKSRFTGSTETPFKTPVKTPVLALHRVNIEEKNSFMGSGKFKSHGKTAHPIATIISSTPNKCFGNVLENSSSARGRYMLNLEKSNDLLEMTDIEQSTLSIGNTTNGNNDSNYSLRSKENFSSYTDFDNITTPAISLNNFVSPTSSKKKRNDISQLSEHNFEKKCNRFVNKIINKPVFKRSSRSLTPKRVLLQEVASKLNKTDIHTSINKKARVEKLKSMNTPELTICSQGSMNLTDIEEETDNYITKNELSAMSTKRKSLRNVSNRSKETSNKQVQTKKALEQLLDNSQNFIKKIKNESLKKNESISKDESLSTSTRRSKRVIEKNSEETPLKQMKWNNSLYNLRNSGKMIANSAEKFKHTADLSGNNRSTSKNNLSNMLNKKRSSQNIPLVFTNDNSPIHLLKSEDISRSAFINSQDNIYNDGLNDLNKIMKKDQIANDYKKLTESDEKISKSDSLRDFEILINNEGNLLNIENISDISYSNNTYSLRPKSQSKSTDKNKSKATVIDVDKSQSYGSGIKQKELLRDYSLVKNMSAQEEISTKMLPSEVPLKSSSLVFSNTPDADKQDSKNMSHEFKVRKELRSTKNKQLDVEKVQEICMKHSTSLHSNFTGTHPLKSVKSPKNDLTDIRGIKKLFSSPKIPQKSPKNDLTNVRGIRKLLSSPKTSPKSPKNDLTNVRSIKKLFSSPSQQTKSPKNDLSDVRGVRALMLPKKYPKSPKNDLNNIKGVKWLLSSPMKPVKSPKNDLTNVQGVKNLMLPKKILKSPKNDLTNPRGVKKLLSSPQKRKSPKNDLSDIRGVRRMMTAFERKSKSPKNDLGDVSGVQKLFSTPVKRPKSSRNDSSVIVRHEEMMSCNNALKVDSSEIKIVASTCLPEKLSISLKKTELKNNLPEKQYIECEVLSKESKTFNDKESSSDFMSNSVTKGKSSWLYRKSEVLFSKPNIKTYTRSKSLSPRKQYCPIPPDSVSSTLKVEQWINNQNVIHNENKNQLLENIDANKIPPLDDESELLASETNKKGRKPRSVKSREENEIKPVRSLRNRKNIDAPLESKVVMNRDKEQQDQNNVETNTPTVRVTRQRKIELTTNNEDCIASKPKTRKKKLFSVDDENVDDLVNVSVEVEKPKAGPLRKTRARKIQPYIDNVIVESVEISVEKVKKTSTVKNVAVQDVEKPVRNTRKRAIKNIEDDLREDSNNLQASNKEEKTKKGRVTKREPEIVYSPPKTRSRTVLKR